jgi:glycosyltransferase involved in cell wall biosynthesis
LEYRVQAELVVLSHLRWTFVWQRPQHIISRLATDRRTWFVEEPLACDVAAPRLCMENHGSVTRVWLEVPGDGHGVPGDGPGRHVGFDHLGAATYAQAVQQLLGASENRTVWLYTPMALDIANALQPSKLIYDVMDDLASFKGAPAELRLRHRQALRQADVVFTGGRSLHRGVLSHRPQGTHLFASGVEPEHFAAARTLRPASRPAPVAGYVGVIDERVDLDLLRDTAAALHDWEIHVVGPVAKIDPESLPQAPNLFYPGPQPYACLPEVMAGFDVALMPFALNEATRSISPTKTLEYFAAGLPVVSTRVPDVVAEHSAHVHLADDGPAFADACRRARRRPRAGMDAVVRRNTWDSIAARMTAVIEGADSAVGELA